MGSGEVAIVALSTMISLKVTFSDGLGAGVPWRGCRFRKALGPEHKMTPKPFSLRYLSHKFPKSITFVGDRCTPATRASSMNPWLPLLANL